MLVSSRTIPLTGRFRSLRAYQPRRCHRRAHCCLSVQFKNSAALEDVTRVLENYQAPEEARELPSLHHPVILLRKEQDRPQPRLDRMTGKGMTTVLGACPRSPF